MTKVRRDFREFEGFDGKPEATLSRTLRPQKTGPKRKGREG